MTAFIREFDEKGLESLAAQLAVLLQAGDFIGLSGTLGAGKSVFCRALIQTLCGKDCRVPSPTFTLVEPYEIEHTTLWHADFFRLSSPEEALEAGWHEMLTGISLVEWPEKITPLLPAHRLMLQLDILPDFYKRLCTITAHGLRADSLLQRLQEKTIAN
ncbi:MAG: tRNA (adenosine(37)-N6)-threonylcarbamoyltransferase complex ATPase subunit type 1 TsaE [Alphaproteobacteria bacterium]